MSGNKVLDLPFKIAVTIVNLADGVTAPKSSNMTDQLAGAATSVGANIHEAHPAKSKRKMSTEKTATSNSPVAYTIR